LDTGAKSSNEASDRASDKVWGFIVASLIGLAVALIFALSWQWHEMNGDLKDAVNYERELGWSLVVTTDSAVGGYWTEEVLASNCSPEDRSDICRQYIDILKVRLENQVYREPVQSDKSSSLQFFIEQEIQADLFIVQGWDRGDTDSWAKGLEIRRNMSSKLHDLVYPHPEEAPNEAAAQ